MANNQELLNVVVVGASFAGLSVAHHFLDSTVARLSTTSTSPRYRLVLVSPSTHIYWNIGAPRTLVSSNLIKEDEAFVPIEPGFKRHKGANFVFVQGLCTTWDPEKRVIVIDPIGAKAQKRCSQLKSTKRVSKETSPPKTPISTNGSLSAPQTIPYHALILATGTSAHSDLLSLHGPHTSTINSLNDFRARIPSSTFITVCGGGPSGVETAGQLATYLNHPSFLPNFLLGPQQANPPKVHTHPKKQITLIAASSRLLPNLPPKVGQQAESQLLALGVTIHKSSRVTSTTPSKELPGKTLVTLADGTALATDLYVAATGVVPNTTYVPNELRDQGDYITTDARTLRVPFAGDRVYAIGDCASYSSNYVLDVYAAVAPLMGNLHNDLLAWELRNANRYGGNEDRIAELEDVVFVRNERVDSQLCPIGRRGGVGVLFGVVLPSLMVYLAKGVDYRVGKAKKVVVDGNNPY